MSLAHQHGPHCSHGHRHHDHDSNVHKPGPGEHVHGKDCSEHQGHKKCKHGSDEKYKELTPKEYEKRRNKRKLRQWSRRGNHTLQNIIAAVWIWSLPESEIRYYYDYYMYDKILLFHALQILALILFFISSLAEPGFLSSNAIPNDTNDKLKKNEDEAISLLSSTDDIDAENPGMVAVDPNNKPPPSFCRSCKFLRPLRAKHCYMCDRCVPRFDHHCPLIEQCVGAKNYRQFYVLCWAQMFVSGWSFLISINCLFYSDSTNRSYIGWFWRIGLFLWMLYQAFMALSLVSFHTYLVCTQQTTYEYLKPRKLKERLQFEQQNESSLSADLLGDIRPKERRRKGIPGPLVLMRKMCIAMGFCLCEYPFSEGLMKNWYGFVTAKCLERPEYFKTIPVKLVRSTPEVSNDATSDHAPNVDLNQVDAAK